MVFMRVLWLCNVLLPKVANHLSRNITHSGGWMVGLSDSLSTNNNIELKIAFPLSSSKSMISGEIEGIKYFGFPQKKSATMYNMQTEVYLSKIVSETQPDIIHVWGTEYPHTLAMMNVCESMGITEKVLISIQGLTSIIAQHYLTGLPLKVQSRFTFRDLVKRDNLKQQQRKFVKRGQLEIEALQKVKYVIGRTTWDKACTTQINPKAQYYLCNETLRDEFYKHCWDINRCEKHSIFVSQGSYPLKGLHFMLEAMPLVLKQFPDTKLYVGGQEIIKSNNIKDKLKISSYSKYIKELIRKNHLEKHIEFTGLLNEKKMCERYLQSNVFVSPSSIENSPNSLGEAMILGVPCVASYVGGVSDMLRQNEEGFIYQADAPYMMAYYICEIFGNEELALKFSKNAREHALSTHGREENTKRLMEIYKIILDLQRVVS
jgi:glycosyltransferase involved in cell wall biosynthesis